MSWVGLFIGDCSIISFYQDSRWFRPSHTIKSVVFLLDVLEGVCGKRYIKSASLEQCFRALPNNHECVTPMGFHIAMLLCLLHASLSHIAVARKDTTAGDWVIDSPTTYLPQSLSASC